MKNQMKNGSTRIIFASKSVLKPVVETGAGTIAVSGIRAALGESGKKEVKATREST